MNNIDKKTLARFALLASTSHYNETRKDEYRRLGRRILKATADTLGLPKSDYDIRWNPGGISVSGDHTLHTDRFYLALHDNLGRGSFYYRTCKGRKDYSGGPNQNVEWSTLIEGGIDELAEKLAGLCRT